MQMLKTEYLNLAALVAAISIWLVSLYTNLVGAKWIFGEKTGFPWISSLFALAISLCLLIVALHLANSVRRRRGIARATALYLVIFTLSSSFTYQALFLRFSLVSENEEARLAIGQAIQAFRATYEVCLRGKWNIDSKEGELAKLKEDTEFERIRADRKGEGYRYLALLQRQRIQEADLKNLRSRLLERLNDLDRASLEHARNQSSIGSMAERTAEALTITVNRMKADECSAPLPDGVRQVLEEARSKDSPLYAFHRLLTWREPRLPVALAVTVSILLELVPLILFIATTPRTSIPISRDRGDWTKVV